MKELHGAHKFANAISTSAESVAKRVLERYADRGTVGREEDISSQLVGEISDHLLEEISKNIKDVTVPGVKFDAITYKKKTEKSVGADIAGAITYTGFGNDQTKVFLVQAKVASSAKKTDAHSIILKGGDGRLLKQCEDMLAITPAAFVFVYSEFGVHVIPATEITISQTSSIDTSRLHYKELGTFYEEVYKCFIGDLKLGGKYRDEKKMKEICESLKADRALALSVVKSENAKSA